MVNRTVDKDFVDLEIRIFPHRDGGYPVEITLGGQQEFPRGHLAADILPWENSSDPAADGRRLFDTLFADKALRSAWDVTTRRLFVLAGHCVPNQSIPCKLLEQAAAVDEDACDESLITLTSLGLLEVDDPKSGPIIHPLLAEYARHQEMEPAPLPALADALASLAREANDQMDQTGSLFHFVPLLPHVRVVAEAAEGEAAEDAARLWNSLGYHLDRVADYGGARAAIWRGPVDRDREERGCGWLGMFMAALSPFPATGVDFCTR